MATGRASCIEGNAVACGEITNGAKACGKSATSATLPLNACVKANAPAFFSTQGRAIVSASLDVKALDTENAQCQIITPITNSITTKIPEQSSSTSRAIGASILKAKAISPQVIAKTLQIKPTATIKGTEPMSLYGSLVCPIDFIVSCFGSGSFYENLIWQESDAWREN